MEFYLVFSVFYVHLVHIFPPNFRVRRHGIQEVSGLMLLISTNNLKIVLFPVFLSVSRLTFKTQRFSENHRQPELLQSRSFYKFYPFMEQWAVYRPL